MCGRFVLPYTWREIYEHYQGFVDALDREAGLEVANAPPRSNIAPTQPVLVIHEPIDGPPKRRAGLMRWGLMPVWVKDPKDFPLIINARSETINEKASFRGGLRHHRCIVPAGGYYEWRTGPDGKKQPFYITLADGGPMALAGIYSTWLGADGSEIDTVAVATLPATGEMKALHDRVPAIIPDADLNDWLDIKKVDEKQAYEMLRPLPEGMLRFHPVSRRVNAVRNDDEGLIEPVSEDKPLPPKQGELF